MTDAKERGVKDGRYVSPQIGKLLDERKAKLAAIQRAVQDGTYRVPSDRLAETLLTRINKKKSPTKTSGEN